MSWTQDVIRLQDLDAQIAKNRQRLDEIEAQLGDTAELLAARQECHTLEKAADVARKAQQDLEFQLNQVQVKRERDEASLYSGRITNSRELQDLQEEVASLKRRISAIEDELLEAMMAREEAVEAAQAAADHCAKVKQQTEAAQVSLTTERADLQEENAALDEERDYLRQGMPDAIVDSYDYLSKRIRSRPVAVLKGDICGVCGIVVTPRVRQQVGHGQEAYCNNCRRLLVG